MFHILPDVDCMIDEIIHVKVSQLQPSQRITLRCETVEKKFVFDSHAHFIADYNGDIDLSLSPSFGGSYKGVDGMGIFWSMLPAEGQKLGLKYVPNNILDGCKFKLQLFDGFLNDENFMKPHISKTTDHKLPIVEKVILRRFCKEGVTREEIQHGRIRGVLYKPQGPGPFKGVIDIYGSGGGLVDLKASLFASHGFVTMILPFFLYKDLPKNVSSVDYEYFLEAIDYFSSLPFVLPGISLVGLSFGGTIVMFLSSICPKIAAVVSISPSYVLVTDMCYKGRSYPRVDSYPDDLTYEFLGLDKRGGFISHFYIKNLNEEIQMKIENSSAKFLVIVGEDDNTYHSDLDGRRFKKRLKDFGKEDQIRVLSYPNAGHFIEPPFLPQTLIHYNPGFKTVCSSGGEPIENGMACLHSWKEVLNFLHNNTGKGATIISKL